jgi:transmembrane sensor
MRLEHWRTDPDAWDRIERYVAGTLSASERTEVQAYLQGHPGVEQSFMATYEEASVIAGDGVRAIDPHHRWTELASRLGIASHATPKGRRRRAVPQRPTWIGGALAGVVAVGVMGIGWQLVRNAPPEGRVHTYATTTGERSVVRLGDGTRITLAPQTTLRVSDGTARGTGVFAELNGEAMFDVVANTRAPFIVHTGRISTRVLGTSFDVRHYADDRDTRVAVAAGKVVVTTASARTAITLTMRTVGHITDSTATSAADTDVKQYTDWTHGRLVFRATPVREALVAFGRWYGYQFRLTDSTLAETLITASFDYRDGRDALRALTTVLEVQATTDGAVVVLSPVRRRAVGPKHRGDYHIFTPSRAMGR